MLDVAIAYNRYKFLGNEFLTWLWFCIENPSSMSTRFEDQPILIEIGNRMVVELNHSEKPQLITIKGDDAGFEEGFVALKKGAFISELNLILQSGDQRWQFTIKGESLNFSGLNTPEVGRPETAEDIDGAVLEKIYMFEKIIDVIEYLFSEFIHIRLSDDWSRAVVPKIKQWIEGSVG